MSGIDIIVEDLSNHPSCIHGPTLLFAREVNGDKREYFACSACRDRKLCSFFLWKSDLERHNKKKRLLTYCEPINHQELYNKYLKISKLEVDKRIYCHTCSILDSSETPHENHEIIEDITNYKLEHPSELLLPLEDPKKEAQYLFSLKCVERIVEIVRNLNYENVICIGTPRIFEYIKCKPKLGLNAILLDIDSRFHSFFKPDEFCWFNMFNDHFFLEGSEKIFQDFLKIASEPKTILITDPPFGGRVEPIACTLNKINQQWKKIHNAKSNLPIFWIFPYFMEAHILNNMSDFAMLDYKINYDNHPLFQTGKKGRKFGSPVRIFTNLNPCSIILPADEDYKYCFKCDKWVYKENKHCEKCGNCTSKDGRTYVHCEICTKCVKPTWFHCNNCGKCAQKDHSCSQIEFKKTCFHCKKEGHKKRDCPEVNHEELGKKRKLK